MVTSVTIFVSDVQAQPQHLGASCRAGATSGPARMAPWLVRTATQNNSFHRDSKIFDKCHPNESLNQLGQRTNSK